MAVRLEPTRWAVALGVAGLAAGLGLLAGLNPGLSIAASLGFAFLVVAFVDLGVGIAIFGFVGFLELVPASGAALSGTKLMGLLLALGWLAAVTTQGRQEPNLLTAHPGISLTFLILLGWSALSVTWAQDQSAALGSAGRWALNAALFVIVFSAVRDRRDLRVIVMAFLAGALTAAAYGLLTVGPSSGERLQSTGLDPNELAAVLVAGVSLAVVTIALNERRPGFQLAGLLAGAACVIALFLTASRGGLIALGAEAIFAVIVAARWRLAVLVVALLVSMSAYVYLNGFAPQAEKDRIQQVTRGETQAHEGRTTIWQLGWREFADHPLEGVGAGNFRTASRHVLLRPGSLHHTNQIISKAHVAHNTYLEVLAELGVVGMSLFGAVILFSIGALLRAARGFRIGGDRQMQAVAIALAVGLFGSLAADFFISQEYSKQLWLLLGLGPAILAIAHPKLGTTKP